ncbi:ABC transporter substrate-binding protein [soil metagenome]
MRNNKPGAASALVGASLALMTCAASAQQGVTDNEVLLGEVVPLSGAASVGSLGLSAGTKMAIAEANAAGGINGRKLRLISEDDGYNVTRTVQGARKLMTSDKVFALTATSGPAGSLAILSMIKQAGIPAVNVLSFPTTFWDPIVPNIFVAGATHQDSAEQLAVQLSKRFPKKKWGIVTQDDETGSLLREGFEKAAKSLNLDVVYRSIYRKGQKDFSSEMLAASKAGIEILFAGGVLTENVAMVKEAERLEMKIPIGLSWIGRQSSATLQMMGSSLDNVYLIDYVVSDESPQGRAFQARARALLGDDDFKYVNRFSLPGYAGTKALIEAMNRCGKALTWTCTIKQMEGLKNYETNVMAPISFSPQSHFSRQALMLMKANPKTFTYQPLD